jgi:hypothetical protein
MAVGIAVMTVVVFAKQIGAAVPAWAPTLAPLAAIAYPWFVLIGTAVTLLVGISSSLVRPRRQPALARVT